VFHINMLKQYFSRDDPVQSNPEADEIQEVAVAVLEEETDDQLEVCLHSSIEGDYETVLDVHISPDLKEDQREELLKLLDEFSDIFTDLPGKTSVAEHRIQLTDDRPIRCKPYPLPHTLRDEVKSEFEEMCRLGVIERSNSPYSSPLLLVKKKDGSNRPVVDFR